MGLQGLNYYIVTLFSNPPFAFADKYSVEITQHPSLRLLLGNSLYPIVNGINKSPPLCLLSSNGQCFDLSTTCHICHTCLKTNPNLTLYSVFPSYKGHPLLLSFKVMYCIFFPPSFELTGDWTPHRQTGLLLPSTNQGRPQEISNCGKKQVLH